MIKKEIKISRGIVNLAYYPTKVNLMLEFKGDLLFFNMWENSFEDVKETIYEELIHNEKDVRKIIKEIRKILRKEAIKEE